MSFYDETLKARHEDDDDEYGDIGGSYGEGGMEEILALLKPIAGEGKVPVKMTIGKNGKNMIKSELKQISEEKLDDYLFQIPKDYEIVKQ